MKRKPIKTVSNEEREFIPKAYKDMDRDAPDMYDRPLIIKYKRLKREQRYEIQAMTHLKYNRNPLEVNIKSLQPGDIDILGQGNASKYVWENCITKVLNVIVNENGTDKCYDEYPSHKELWDCEGLDDDITETIAYIMDESKLSEGEEKN